MTPDEYEARLRNKVMMGVTVAVWANDHPVDQIVTPLDAYADWLRLRAVAEIRICLSPWTKCKYGQPGGYFKGRLCEVHEAQQKLDAILAAEGGAE